MSALQSFKRHLKPGNVYRREDLVAFSNAVDRHLQELVLEGFLSKLETGLYYRPKQSDFGPVPPSDEKLVKAFLKDDDFLVIIDNMMNLELLFWATKNSNDSIYYDIAIKHANTTMKNHFRIDNSSYHVLNYSKADGSVKAKRTAQGFSDESAWARGQAWGLYGYTVMYRETKDQKYLNQAISIADFILNKIDQVLIWC